MDSVRFDPFSKRGCIAFYRIVADQWGDSVPESGQEFVAGLIFGLRDMNLNLACIIATLSHHDRNCDFAL